MLPHATRAQTAGPAMGRALTVYFSRTGNTRAVAERIHALAGGDLAEIRTVHAYPAEYRATTEVAKQEQEDDARPALASSVADIAAYDTLFIGYPNWWGTLPMAFFTFFGQHDFSGKTIAPFCTHEGSGLGRGPADLRAHCRGATILSGLALRGGSGGYARGEGAGRQIDAWVAGLKLVPAQP